VLESLVEFLPAIAVFAVLLLSFSWHEAAHAWVADRLGDPTARRLGRVTLNPLKHLDPFLSLVLPAVLFFSFGFVVAGGKPVPVDVRYFRRPTRDFMYVALAGPGSNILLAIVFGALLVLTTWTGIMPVETFEHLGRPDLTTRPGLVPIGQADSLLELVLQMGVAINVGLALFNLMPIPPLDGSRVIGWALPRAAKRTWYSLDRFGILVVLVFVFALDGFRLVFDVVVGVLTEYDELLGWLIDHNPLA